jgi:hypothetical protein
VIRRPASTDPSYVSMRGQPVATTTLEKNYTTRDQQEV